MIIDHAIIEVSSGKGGNGAVTFRREKYIAKGGPDGGDGGDGGSVVLVADPQVDTLLDFAGRHHWRAEHGEDGRNKQQYGKKGDDLEIHLPAGTLIYNNETGELITDLDAPGKKFIVAKGGRGGFGNEHFKSSTNQVPRESTPGEPAIELELRLELKLIAELGLLGKPNAGKSTMLARISKATPKIADYPFTTLQPNLGIAELTGHRRIVVADIPGLIEGAASGAGLGTRFLRHVERTRLLLHVIEPEPTDGSDPIENYHIIRKELAKHAPQLAAKHEVVALSKIDLFAEDDRAALVELLESALGIKIYPVSAATGEGLGDLLEACWQFLHREHDSEGQPTGSQRW